MMKMTKSLPVVRSNYWTNGVCEGQCCYTSYLSSYLSFPPFDHSLTSHPLYPLHTKIYCILYNLSFFITLISFYFFDIVVCVPVVCMPVAYVCVYVCVMCVLAHLILFAPTSVTEQPSSTASTLSFSLFLSLPLPLSPYSYPYSCPCRGIKLCIKLYTSILPT